MAGEIPLSNALSEPSPQSIQELWALDPEKWSERDLDQTITEMRRLRERLAAAELTGTKVKQVRVAKSPPLPLGPPNPNANPEEFGL